MAQEITIERGPLNDSNSDENSSNSAESSGSTPTTSSGEAAIDWKMSNNKYQPVQKKGKQKSPRISRALQALLADSEWYVDQLLETGHERPSSLRIEKLKSEQVTKIASHQASRAKKPLTEEQKAARKQRNLERKQKKLEEQARKKEERKRRAEEAKKHPKKKVKKEGTYYSGDSLQQLLNATEFFTHTGGEDFDELSKRKVKPVHRWAPEIDRHPQRRARVQLKTLKRSVQVKKEKKPKTKAKKSKKRASKHKINPIKKGQETKSKKKMEEKKKQVTMWFSDLTNENFIDIKNRRMFIDSVYELKEDTYVPDDAIQARDLVKNNMESYATDDPKFPPTEITLEYPFSSYKENYMLAVSKREMAFNAFDELGRHMELLAFTFMPPGARKKVVDLDHPKNCIIGRYITNFEGENFEGILSAVEEFNTLMRELRRKKLTMKFTSQRTDFPSVTIYELLDLCYARAVMPESKKLRSYKAFSNYTYGELMPTFLSRVYKQCNLDKDSCFIDLGSGVANCVIQAAIEFGCRSYGVEIAGNASDLGDAQAAEFERRCRIMGLNHGPVELFSRQSFADNPAVKKVVDESNVILCNNYLFDAELNQKVVELFANLKVGTKIISLKPIVPPGFTVNWNNAGSILSRLKTKQFIYDVNSVSWTSTGGFYYITEVMGDIVDDNFVLFQSRSRRHHQFGEPRSRSTTPMNAFTNNV